MPCTTSTVSSRRAAGGGGAGGLVADEVSPMSVPYLSQVGGGGNGRDTDACLGGEPGEQDAADLLAASPRPAALAHRAEQRQGPAAARIVAHPVADALVARGRERRGPPLGQRVRGHARQLGGEPEAPGGTDGRVGRAALVGQPEVPHAEPGGPRGADDRDRAEDLEQGAHLVV